MNILLNLPIKEFSNGKPKFIFQMHKMVGKLIPNLSKLQHEYQNYLRKQVRSLI
ncbi:MAG: hypothetical protein UV01_C0005G0039 [Parcubacteria group bacterium GW2011_GWA2_42_14]|nr:MAG: hypothetical protein UV01_C0005G0039 [Parcubacteria group bacterium GW2011_GWA2_42_14]